MDSSNILQRCWAEVDLPAMERNLALAKSKISKDILFVADLRADAYGHGLHQSSSRLMSGAVDAFAVTGGYEAEELLEIGSGWPILLLSNAMCKENIYTSLKEPIPIIRCEEELKYLQNLNTKKKLTYFACFDKYYNQEEFLDFLECTKKYNLILDGIYLQKSLKISLIENYLKKDDSLENSSKKILLIDDTNNDIFTSINENSNRDFNLAILSSNIIYGINSNYPCQFSDTKFESVLSFKTRITLIKDLPKGTKVSYGGTYTLKRDSKVALTGGGYADGVPTSASNKGYMLVNGQKANIIGRVTMDQILLDITDIKGQINVSDEVVIIGTQKDEKISASDFCEFTKKNPAEVLASITKRVPRIYKF